jgi:hypothetical protein
MENKQQIEEAAYTRGQRDLLLRKLSEILRELGYEHSDVDISKEVMIKERESTIQALRIVCDDFGDNDWDEQCDLSSVIINHLGKHLRKC